MKCGDCVFSEVLVKKGTPYTILNPVGTEITRVHEDTVLICRAMPPLGGSFPQVTEDDWCGQFSTAAEDG
jgi:hypothetical protein